ncbi:hypothetical protein P5673_005047 [Acropora cervicornis]|uniref:Uncharacterized protein n=1 Tax=Acropora cervicornis TaxID=6130 RepID=A0AAD9QZE2_ACRCE|nr:hypothetical protein P5673_005047 [Acropora cervicornis]
MLGFTGNLHKLEMERSHPRTRLRVVCHFSTTPFRVQYLSEDIERLGAVSRHCRLRAWHYAISFFQNIIDDVQGTSCQLGYL